MSGQLYINMIVFPNAKINIGLNITSRRADGYHEIVTVMVPVPWTDILEIVPAKSDQSTLNVSGRTVNCPAEKNLVMKAYRAMESQFNLPPVDIHLHKIIPDGAGLGGGSADAAFTIKALNDLFNLSLPDSRLASIAAGIGADCPFFIFNRPMLATGIGTDLTPIDIDLSGKTIVIIKPNDSVSTAEAYAGVSPKLPDTPLPTLLNELSISKWQNTVVNDFEHSVFPKHPSIAAIKSKLLDLGAVYASMSGSGSAVYALFDSEIMSDRIEAKFPGTSTFCRTF